MTIILEVPGKGEREFSIPHATGILQSQAKQKHKATMWQIKKGQPYKFVDNELLRIRNTRKGKKSKGERLNTEVKDVSEQA